MTGSRTVEFTVNGREARVGVEPTWSLVDVLRRELDLTGTKLGCGVGVCGVCSVIVDGELQSACLVPAVQLDGRTVETIEGMANPDGSLSTVQDAFIEYGGFQCGICTPGQIVAATALLRAHPSPTREQIVEWMTGNLCRCTGYHGILRAIESASARRAPATRSNTAGPRPSSGLTGASPAAERRRGWASGAAGESA